MNKVTISNNELLIFEKLLKKWISMDVFDKDEYEIYLLKIKNNSFDVYQKYRLYFCIELADRRLKKIDFEILISKIKNFFKIKDKNIRNINNDFPKDLYNIYKSLWEELRWQSILEWVARLKEIEITKRLSKLWYFNKSEADKWITLLIKNIDLMEKMSNEDLLLEAQRIENMILKIKKII